jgi:hypothetical protein
MKSKTTKSLLVATTIAAAAAATGSNAMAQDASAAQIEGLASGTITTYDNASGAYPVITGILSQPGTFGGHTYTSYSFLAQDSTGSLDIFGTTPALLGTYVPTVGDAISASGTYSPFHQIPELGTVTAVTLQSSGNPVPSPAAATVSQLNQGALPNSIAGHLIELSDVMIGGSGGVGGLFPTYSQATTATETFTVTDGTGSMTLFDWVTSYSTAAALGGMAVPTGPVNVIGFDSVFTSGGVSTAEFTPISITAVPEPATFGFIGGGALALVALFRRNAVKR